MLGRTVRKLVNTTQNAGYKSVVWDASEYSNGIYFYKLTVGDKTFIKKMVLMR